MNSSLKITSHVGRDILQSAQSFQTPEAAIWEYVVNGLQYVAQGTTPTVHVELDARSRRVIVEDNGTGMDFYGLNHFFTMHGENRARRKGVPGRGKFGTGKSAAFGIGGSLEVDTVHNGLRNVVYVDREMIEASSGDQIPVTIIKNNEPVELPNGTTVTIGEVAVRLARDPIVQRIERHLAAFRIVEPLVTVNRHACQVPRPPISSSREFRPQTDSHRELLGDVVLNVKVSRTPLDEVNRGVAVTCGVGNLVAVVTAGIETKEYGNRLLGDIDVPELENPKYEPIAAFGNNRDLRLNPAHLVAIALTSFVGASLETVRAAIVDESRKAKEDVVAARLAAQAEEIAKVLNEDLATQSERIAAMANVRQRTRLAAEAAGPEHADSMSVSTGGLPGVIDGVLGHHDEKAEAVDEPNRQDGGSHGGPGGELASASAHADPGGDVGVAPAGDRGSKRPRGGLTIEYTNNGSDSDRSEWDKERRVIQVNLDHPVVKAARASDDDERAFRRLSYEIAFTQYALAMADLQYERDDALTASDAMFEVRDALRRIWARAALLYAI